MLLKQHYSAKTAFVLLGPLGNVASINRVESNYCALNSCFPIRHCYGERKGRSIVLSSEVTFVFFGAIVIGLSATGQQPRPVGGGQALLLVRDVWFPSVAWILFTYA